MLDLLLPVLIAASADTPPPAWSLPEPLCCSQGYERRAVVATGDADAAGISVRVQPAGTLAASCRALDAARVEIRLQAKAPGAGTIELLDAAHAVRLRRAVQVVAISSDSERHIATEGTRPDGSTVMTGQIIITPYQPGLEVRFACLSPRVTVPDGLAERWIASETFTPDAGGGSAQTTFRMVREPGARWVPFTYILYQDGEQISPP